MPLTAVSPPVPVPVRSGFDYLAADPQRHRIYAAHTGSQALTVVDSQTGKVLGQIEVGPVHGVAVAEATGHVFTGQSDRSVAEVDPVTMQIIRKASDLPGPIDALAYDPSNARIYADEGDGSSVYVLDARTMQRVGTVAIPGHHPEYLAVDSAHHVVYQNVADRNEFVVIDSATLKATKTVPTPAVENNHPLQYDPAFGQVLVGGENGVLAAYEPSGKLVGSVRIQPHVDQCDLDAAHHVMACAGSGMLTILRTSAHEAPTVVTQVPVSAHAHTTAIDPATRTVWTVWSSPSGDFVQGFRLPQ